MDDQEEHRASLIKRGKELTEDGKIKEALALYTEANKIRSTEKLQRKMTKMKVISSLFLCSCFCIVAS